MLDLVVRAELQGENRKDSHHRDPRPAYSPRACQNPIHESDVAVEITADNVTILPMVDVASQTTCTQKRDDGHDGQERDDHPESTAFPKITHQLRFGKQQGRKPDRCGE